MPAANTPAKTKLLRALGLMASASLLSLTMGGDAQAACTASGAQPLNNVTADFSFIDCDGANTGQTIVVNASEVQMQVNSPGDTLDNSSVSFTGTNNLLVIQNGATSANLVFAGNGNSNSIRIVSSATNVAANLFGQSSNFQVSIGGSATAAPGNIVLSANPGNQNSATIRGTLAATGNNGGNYLLTGGTGDQLFTILGTLTVQPNGLAISAGAGDDEINLTATAVVNGGTGNNITFDGGIGNDVLTISGGGTSAFITTNIEQLNLDPGGANTRILQGSGSYNSVFVSGGTVLVNDIAALGQANSAVTIFFTGRMQLDPAAPVTFSHELNGSGQLQQLGQTITYDAPAGAYTGIFTVAGGTAVIAANNVFGTGTIVNNSTVSFGGLHLANSISGTGQVVVTGSGNSRLSGNNTFSGGLDVQGGILDVASVNSLGTGTVTSSTAGAILAVGNAGNQVLTNNLTGNLALAKAGAGILDLTGTNSYTGGTLINGGAVRVDGFARLGTGPVIANAGGNLILNYNGAGQLIQTTPFMTGDGGFIKEGTGDVVMSQTSTYTGGTIIRAGRIGLNNGDALGTGTIQVDTGAILGIGGITLKNQVTGTGSLIKTASNVAELFGDNSGFSGTIDIQDGSVRVRSGNALGTGSVILGAGTDLQIINSTADSTIAASLSGGGAFFKSDANRVTLTGTNALTGTVQVDNGILQIAGGQNIGTAAITLNGAGTSLALATNGSTSLGNIVQGTGRIVKTGTGTVLVTGANTYSGGTDIQQGAIRITDLAALSSGPVTVAAGAALDLSVAGAGTYGGAISGAGILRKSDVGDLTLTANTLTGGLDIVGGRVIVNTTAALGSGPVSTAAGTRLVIDNAAAQTLAQAITGAGGLTKQGAGLLSIAAANSFSGGSLIAAGRVDLANGLGLGSGTITMNTGAQLGLGAVSVGNAIAGAGRVIKFGSGTGSLTGANTYSGGTDIQAGTLSVASPAALGSGGVSIASAAALEVNYAGSAPITLTNALSGAGSLIKSGSGSVSIASANTYTGGTTVNAGQLTANAAGALGTGGIAVNAGGRLGLGAITLANTVSGAGKVVKLGAGTGSLTGANTYSGGTDVLEGTLAIASPASVGTGAVAISGGAILSVTHTGSASAALGNALGGAGGLVKEGTGALVVTGAANSYSGGTAINAGRLEAGANGALGTGGVVIASGAQLGLGAVSLANAISGAGKVIKSGSGTGTLSGANSHSGGTDVEAGTLAVASPGALGSGGVSIAAAANLSVTQAGSTSAALANALSGAGSLTKEGTGTLTIDTANTFSGGTVINAGRLAIGADGALGSGGIAVVSGAQLGIGGISLANAVSGAGKIVKTGSGAGMLTGTNTHSGGIDIEGGSLAVSGNAPLGTGAISIASGASLNYTNAAAAAFGNALSGAGTFAKLGAGQLTFGSNFTVGSLAVNAGRVRLNAVATTNATIAAGAALDGTGRVIGNLTNSGIVAPGNSIGTLTVQGNYVHNSGAVLEIEFDAAGNIDLLDVTGNATLNGGTLRFVSIGGAEGQGGTFLRTGGALTGTFATVETAGAALPLAVIYEANRAFMAPSVLTARPSTFNAQIMAAADTALGFIGSLGAADVRGAGGNRLWMQGFGAWGKRSASGTTLSYDHDTRGLAGGITFAAGDTISVGLAVGWAKGDISLGSGGGGGDQSSVLGAIYARYAGTGFTLGGGLLYGKVDQKTLRNVSFNGFSASVNGATDSKMLGAFAELGLPLGGGLGWAFSANARGSWVRQSQDAYTESGTSPLRLTVGKLRASTLEGQALLSAKTSLWDRSNGGEESPEGLDLRIDLGGRIIATSGDRVIPVTFAASNAGIALQGDTRDAVQAVAGAALDYTLPGGATFSIGYRGELGQTDRHTVQAGVSFAF